jgi:hypothetical protein
MLLVTPPQFSTRSGGIVAVIAAIFLAVVSVEASAIEVTPTAAYHGSTITVGGIPFDGTHTHNHECFATVGSYSPQCSMLARGGDVDYIIPASVTIVIGLGIAPAIGYNVSVYIKYDFYHPGLAQYILSWVNNTNVGNLTVLATPTVASATPTAGYVGSTITVTGTSFITKAQDASASCNATVGGTAGSCSLVGGTSTTLMVTIGTGTTAGAKQVSVNISTAATTVSATSASDFLTVLGAPSLTGATPTAGYAGSTITVTGTSFITTAQDAAASCSTTVSGIAATCSLEGGGGSSSTLRITIGTVTTAGAVAAQSRVGSQVLVKNTRERVTVYWAL